MSSFSSGSFSLDAPSFNPRGKSKVERPREEKQQDFHSKMVTLTSGPKKRDIGSDWGFTDDMVIFGNLSEGTTPEMLVAQMRYYRDGINPIIFNFERSNGFERHIIIAKFPNRDTAIYIASKMNGDSVQGNTLVAFIVADFLDLVKRCRRTIMIASMEERLSNDYIRTFFMKNGAMDFWQTAERREKPPYTACVCFHNPRDFQGICAKSTSWFIPDGKYYVIPAPLYSDWAQRVQEFEARSQTLPSTSPASSTMGGFVPTPPGSFSQMQAGVPLSTPLSFRSPFSSWDTSPRYKTTDEEKARFEISPDTEFAKQFREEIEKDSALKVEPKGAGYYELKILC